MRRSVSRLLSVVTQSSREAGRQLTATRPSQGSSQRSCAPVLNKPLGIVCLGLGSRLLVNSPDSSRDFTSKVTACRVDKCQVEYSSVIGTGTAQVNVGAVQAFLPGGGASSSTLVVTDVDGELLWSRDFNPGYRVIGLDTDVTGHIFARFAVTNHSAIVWVIALSDAGVNDFGTVGGSLPVDDYSETDVAGRRDLTGFRTGWPANTAPDSLVDVFRWNSVDYEFVGCRKHTRPDQAITSGASKKLCPRPVVDYSINLPG